MREELQDLYKNQTWELMPRPSNTNVVGSKWVYRIKHTKDGSIERFKSQLATNGFTQVSGIGYHETFSLVVKPTTIRLVISIGLF